MRGAIILSILGTAAATASAAGGGGVVVGSNSEEEQQRRLKFISKEQHQNERELSGSGDMSFDDDYWAWDEGSMDVYWDDYSIDPKKCMI